LSSRCRRPPIPTLFPYTTLFRSLLWEGLSYYAIVADKEIPWLAQSMTYTKPDFTELTIKLNPAAQWSDGQPVTSQDVLYTFQTQDRKSTRLNSSHRTISYAVFCL